jgi:hypothetical protein
MNVVIHPEKKGKLFVSGFTALETDAYGLSSAEAEWTFVPTERTQEAKWTALQAHLPSMFAAHPIFSFLLMERRNVRYDANEGRWTVRGVFSGIDGDDTEPIYSLDLDGNVESIETHKDFKTFATTANGARFDSNGLFLGFGDKNKPEWFGVTSYVRPGAVWTKTQYSRARPNDLGRVGKIDEPEGYQPPISGSLNWLYLGVHYEQRGGAYMIRKHWKASGSLGWNSTIYS